ncbi:hypothetical protein [Acetobacter malorum]|uniref:hypothetical protein n=1 Tax=Acetobacter malorum TaxID=178901 RepID=UPI0012E7412B|nr:hypothetical protein [Acetobacter malorum]
MKYDQHGPLAAMLSEAAKESGQGSLMAWMEYRHDELLVELGSKRVRWPIWLALFRQLDLRDANGNHPTLETDRKAWQRVRAQKKVAQAALCPVQHYRPQLDRRTVQATPARPVEEDLSSPVDLHPDLQRIRENLSRTTAQRPRPLTEDSIT